MPTARKKQTPVRKVHRQKAAAARKRIARNKKRAHSSKRR